MHIIIFIRSTSVQFDPFDWVQSNQSISTYLVHLGPFCPLVQFEYKLKAREKWKKFHNRPGRCILSQLSKKKKMKTSWIFSLRNQDIYKSRLYISQSFYFIFYISKRHLIN